MKFKIRKFALTVLFFLSLLLIFNLLYNFFKSESIEKQKNKYIYIAENQTSFITSNIDKAITRTYTINDMITDNSGNTDFFDSSAKYVVNSIKEDTGITLRNLAIAPDGIVTKVYPLETNEALIGFDFKDLSKDGNKEALEAYEKGETIITNPFVLVQGGVGIGARTPVYVKKHGNDIFWGIVTATMDFDNLLKVFNLDILTTMQCNYRLWYEDTNRQMVVLDQSGDKFDDAVKIPISIYNLKWNLDVIPEKGWYDKNLEVFFRTIILILDIFITCIALMFFRIRNDSLKMKLLSEQDSLTHCYWRHYLNTEIIDNKTGNWKDSRYEYSVALIDVDNFLSLNESFGHLIGDRVLIAISEVLMNSVNEKSGDRVVRYDGDQFAIFLNALSKEELHDNLKQILSDVNSLHFDDIPELKLSVCIGAAYYDSEKSNCYNKLMMTAEDNLMEAKKSGENSFLLS